VVITIILIISAIALPTILPAMRHRQVSEGARILQGALVGARDAAIHGNAPSGIRLLPDPTLNGINPITGVLDPTQPLAANRIIPIDSAPEYTEGLVNVYFPNPAQIPFNNTAPLTYPILNPDGTTALYPYPGLVPNGLVPPPTVLMVEEAVVAANMVPNSPTSWFWNIRVGDKIQLNQSGDWYTVVGPMAIAPTNPATLGQNPELFVNVGPPGTQSPLVRTVVGGSVNPEFLFLVNGQDDNKNGWIDEGWDGLDNNLDFYGNGKPAVDDLLEWEQETWLGSIATNLTPTQPYLNQPYTIQRRPTPSGNAREVSLPSNVVIDMTTWNNPFQERSHFPPGVVNPYTGYVDILVYPNGTVVPTTIYSAPASFGLSASFFHFWLAERSDVVAPGATGPPFLPIGNIQQQIALPPPPNPRIQGEYRLVTLFTRTGQLITADNVQFDNPKNPANTVSYNTNYPFLAAQQGIKGGGK